MPVASSAWPSMLPRHLRPAEISVKYNVITLSSQFWPIAQPGFVVRLPLSTHSKIPNELRISVYWWKGTRSSWRSKIYRTFWSRIRLRSCSHCLNPDGLNMKLHISHNPGKFNDSYLLKVSNGSRICRWGTRVPTLKKVVVTLNLVMFQENTCQNETKSRPLVGCVPVVPPWICHW